MVLKVRPLIELAFPRSLTSVKEGEIALRKKRKDNTNDIIGRHLIEPKEKSRFKIPLCRFISLPFVRPINEVDVQRLENEFVNGYHEGDRCMCVSIYNNLSDTQEVTEEIMASWSPLWREENEAFKRFLEEKGDLDALKGRMFFVWEGNHRFLAWFRHINRCHEEEKEWHFWADCMVVEPKDNPGTLMNAMHDLNW